MLTVQPISFQEACAFIREHHRHHRPPQGWKWGMAVGTGGHVVGVATVGRPIARHFDDGWTLEVTRCCTDGTPHVASKLYAAAWRAARAMGYRRMVTYTLEAESGTSILAAGWRLVGQTKAHHWSCPSRPRVETYPTGAKTLWEAVSNDSESPNG